jgi:hypothetical protein
MHRTTSLTPAPLQTFLIHFVGPPCARKFLPLPRLIAPAQVWPMLELIGIPLFAICVGLTFVNFRQVRA